MEFYEAKIDREALRRKWFDPTIPFHDIAIEFNCSATVLRQAARSYGLPPRDTIMEPHGPLWEDFETEEEFSEAVRKRAAWVRSKWSAEDEYSRRVVKGSDSVGVICLTHTHDASTFRPTAMPGYMTASLPTQEACRRDRKEGNAA